MEMLTIAFLLGLMGNIHCIGMCGPIALILPVQSTSTMGRFARTLIYNTGRILSYSGIGFFLGILGTGLKLAKMLQWSSITIGSLLILYVIAPHLLNKYNPFTSTSASFNGWLTRLIGRRLQDNSFPSLFYMGLLNGLLPCGMVLTAGLASIPWGGITDSILFMIFFGLGTLPVMVILPMISHTITTPVRKKLQRAVPILIFAFGVLFILRGLNLGIPYLSPKLSGDKTEIQCGN